MLKKLLCGLLCAMVCATAAACASNASRPGFGEGTESQQSRETETPTEVPTAEGDPTDENAPTGGENTPAESEEPSDSGSGNTPEDPDNPPATPQQLPSAADLLAMCNAKMATVATFGMQSKQVYDLQGAGTASAASGISQNTVSSRLEGLGTDSAAFRYDSLYADGSATSVSMTDGAYYQDMNGQKVKVTANAEQYALLFGMMTPTGDYLTYTADDFGSCTVSTIEGGYRLKCANPNETTLQEILFLFGEDYVGMTLEDISEFSYIVETDTEGRLLREYVFVKMNVDLDAETYGAGAMGILRLTYEDTYGDYDTAHTIAAPEDADSYLTMTFEQVFGGNAEE